ncbi:uncharacterized protein DFL_002214 [Arthrobotrys flagrans]|uniref:SPRY domain-containing protein n=1 Tax=Arthrobotrys flagrans TaxID=97331 RepID=A0A437A9U8_ARTFL|nr:hypothetical protein DFL_002214 [Arthrobotrys flagrans]
MSIARKLLEAGANPNAQDSDSRTPLLDAAFSLNKEGVELLLEEKYKVDINDEDVNGQTVLIALASYVLDEAKSLELVNLLIEHGADIKPRAKNGWTAFISAVWYERWGIADVLMAAYSKERGDDHSYLTQKDINDETILHFAATDRCSGIKIAKLILGELTAAEISKFLEEREPSKGRTALQKSFTKRNLDFALYLIECGANFRATDSSGESVADTFFKLWMASRKCSDYDLNTSWETWTKLYCNIQWEYKKLSEAGIDPLKKDSEGWDAFDWAYACHQKEMMQECFTNFDVDDLARTAEWRDKFPPITKWDAERSQPPMRFLEVDNIVELAKDYQDTHIENESDICDRSLCPNPSRTCYAAVTNHPISPYAESFYYEATILKAKAEKLAVVIVGLVGEGAPTSELPGWGHKNIATYGFHGDDGRVYAPEWAIGDNNGKELPAGASPIGVGDTIGCGYDNLNHNVFWTLNGRYLGGFRGFTCLRPALSLGRNGVLGFTIHEFW